MYKLGPFVAVSVVLLSLFFCSKQINVPSERVATPAPTKILEQNVASNQQGQVFSNSDQNQKIRTIDFANFTYQWFPSGIREKPDKQVTLTKGKTFIPRADDEIFISAKVELYHIDYYDFDDDGNEEAVVVVWTLPEKAAFLTTFVFKYDEGKAQQIWVNESGTRADKGLRNLYIQDNTLIVEEYNRAKNGGLNVAPTFSRSFYKLGKAKMVLVKTDTIPNDQPDNEPNQEFFQRNIEIPKELLPK